MPSLRSYTNRKNGILLVTVSAEQEAHQDSAATSLAEQKAMFSPSVLQPNYTKEPKLATPL